VGLAKLDSKIGEKPMMKTIFVCIVTAWVLHSSAFVVAEAQTENRRGVLRDWIRQKLEGRSMDKPEDSTDIQEIEANYDSFHDAPMGPGNYRRRINHDGRERFYEMHIPPGYSDTQSMPVVLVFHGGGGRPLQQRNDSQMDSIADANNFIVVYPAGTSRFGDRLLTFNGGICCAYAKKNNIDDVGFTESVLADVGRLFNVDSRKVYATGFSNGAFLAYRLACELSDKIAAIGPVSGVLGIDQCTPSRHVPIIHFHGREDPNAVYEGGIGPNAKERIPRRGVKETINIFLDSYGLSRQPTETSRAGEVLRERWGPDRDGVEIVLYTIDDAGHTWPGGRTTVSESKVGKLSLAIRASELMWEFFKRYSLP
jgi:polyhydroxybutyrate depolymerase